MSDCIFCRIVRGELPCEKLYEDDAVLAFMDIGPIVKGHALVIPKAHHELITDLPPHLLAPVLAVVQRVARGLYTGLKADGVNVHQTNGAASGQVVPHVHFHVIPRFHTDGHSWNWRAGSYADRGEMQGLADKIRAALPPAS
ncbi:MAG TPA: HIT family protein [Kiritimatiellia bacterium]|nr:HIT family protein [Kiritimatiellia bacterium]